jgi:hypothetical protein
MFVERVEVQKVNGEESIECDVWSETTLDEQDWVQ